MLFCIRSLFVVPPMPTIDLFGPGLKKNSGCALLGLPVRPDGDEEGVNLLLCQEVAAALPLAKGSQPVFGDCPVHLLWVHPQLLGCFFDRVVVHRD